MNPIAAHYGGDADHAGSSSAPLSVTVLDALDGVFRNGFDALVGACPVE